MGYIPGAAAAAGVRLLALLRLRGCGRWSGLRIGWGGAHNRAGACVRFCQGLVDRLGQQFGALLLGWTLSPTRSGCSCYHHAVDIDQTPECISLAMASVIRQFHENVRFVDR